MKHFFTYTQAISLLLLLSLFLTVMLSRWAMSVLAQNTPLSVIDTTEDPQALGYPDSRKFVADSQGRFYVAYRKKFRQVQAIRYHIFVARSTDQGATWTVLNQGRPIEAVGDYTQRVPSLAIDGADVLHLVWYGEDASSAAADERQIKYVRSTDGGATWSTWQNIAPVPGYGGQTLWQEHPVIHAAGDGNLYIVWQGRDATYTVNSQVKFTQSTDGGVTWSSWRNIHPDAGRYFSRPSLIAAPNSNVLYLAAYSGAVSAFAQLVWSTSLDDGATWSPWSLLSPSDQDQRHLSLIVDLDGRLHAAWRQRPTGADATMPTQIHHAVWAGNGWRAPTVVSANATAYQFFPSLTIGRDGRRWLSWLETAAAAQFPADDPQNGTIYYVTQPATEQTLWSARVQLRPATTDLYPTFGWYTKPAQPQHNCDQTAGVELLWVETVAVEQNRLRYTCLTMPPATPTPTATNTPTPTATNTPLPTATNTPTPTATNTPLPTATNVPPPAAISKILLSSQTDSTVGGVSFSDEDILSYDPATGVWAMLLDGSDVGLAGLDLSNFQFMADNSILMSFDARVTLPNAGTVERSDIVKFTPTSLGTSTAGSWALYFDGSDVGLADSGEYLDAMGVDAAGRLLISTEGTFKAGGLTAQDEDLLAFTATRWGSATAGSWALYFDGSDVGLTDGSEDVNSIALRNAKLYLTTKGLFAVNSLRGDQNDIFACTPLSLGNNTNCSFALVFNGNGLLSDVDALSLEETVGLAVRSAGAARVTDAAVDAGAQYPILADEVVATEIDPELDAYDAANDGSAGEEASLTFRVFLPLAAR